MDDEHVVACDNCNNTEFRLQFDYAHDLVLYQCTKCRYLTTAWFNER